MTNLLIGSHCGLKAPDYFLDSVKEALSYQANAMMIYTGAPQNSMRKPIDQLKVEEGKQLWLSKGLSLDNIIVHAPYTINLANCENENTFNFGVECLINEIIRTQQMGLKYVVLHPGCCLKSSVEAGIEQIVSGLKIVLEKTSDSQVSILLETMAGKGSEVGCNTYQLCDIIKKCSSDRIVACLDTCHLHDSGYDLNQFDTYLDEFDQMIGIDKIKCVHLNNSKNIQGSKKDRHANLKNGEIAFETLRDIASNSRLQFVPKILETPYVDGLSIYDQEIELLKG
ncbi:MAG: deoxyribonuclease IV [Erysipelotrichaceae bacterium]